MTTLKHPCTNNGASPANSAITPCSQASHIIHMHVDANRDGLVDDDYTGLNRWTWGKGKRGAIILCNNDNDDNVDPPKRDNSDNKINGNNDEDDIAPLEFRVEGNTSPPRGMKGYLTVSREDAKRIRIFNGRSAGAKEIIGPRAGNFYKFPDLNFKIAKYGMETIKYAGTNFDGKITISFKLKGGGIKKYKQKAVVKVAPWILPNHNDRALKVFVVDLDTFNFDFRKKLKILVEAAGCVFDQSCKSNDRWITDCMAIGYSNLPKKGMRVVVRAPRNEDLKKFPITLLKPDFGFHRVGTIRHFTNFDSTGNLMVTPPVVLKNGKKYPFGRLYYGPGRRHEWMDIKFRTFLKNQIVQKPIEVNTRWLAVGHVDEIITFVPATDGKGFKMLLADTKLAYNILRKISVAHGDSKLLVGGSVTHTTRAHGDIVHSLEISIDKFLNGSTMILGHSSKWLKKYNSKIQNKLIKIKQQFMQELNLDPVSDIIHVPMIFTPNKEFSNQADALIGNMVNMLVINKHCIISKPWGPVLGGKDLFEANMRSKLELFGLTVNFLDDWDEYHTGLGEIHCGTNTIRGPTMSKWWEFKP